MKKIASLLLGILIFVFFADESKAIIIIPAVILIPIVKLVAIIISGFTIPIFGITTYFHKLSNKPIIRGIYVSIAILLALATLIAIVLKLMNPSRPLF